MQRHLLKRKTSLQNQEVNQNRIEINYIKSNSESSKPTSQLIQKAMANDKTEESFTDGSTYLPKVHMNKQEKIIQKDFQIEKLKQSQSSQKVNFNLRYRQPLPLQNQSKKIHRIHHISQEKQVYFSQMFYGRSGIRGKRSEFKSQPKQSCSENKVKFQCPLAIINNCSSFKPSKDSIVGKENKKIQFTGQVCRKLILKKSFSKQSLKQNKDQYQRIEQLLNRAKEKIQKDQLFKLSYGKHRILDIKLRQRIKSDIVHEKLKDRIEKMKSLSASKKKQNQSSTFLKKQRIQMRKMIKRQEQINKFKNIIQSKGGKKLQIR